MAGIVATRYANALAEIIYSLPDKPFDETLMELRSFEQMLQGTSELRNVLLSPAVPSAKKRAVVGQFAEMMPLSRTVKNFLFVLIDHRRIWMFPEMRKAFEEALDSRLDIVRAEVESAAPLNQEQQGYLQQELSRVTGKQVRVQFDVDANLIGGVMAKIGSTIYDGSVRAQLNGLRERLTGR